MLFKTQIFLRNRLNYNYQHVYLPLCLFRLKIKPKLLRKCNKERKVKGHKFINDICNFYKNFLIFTHNSKTFHIIFLLFSLSEFHCFCWLYSKKSCKMNWKFSLINCWFYKHMQTMNGKPQSERNKAKGRAVQATIFLPLFYCFHNPIRW